MNRRLALSQLLVAAAVLFEPQAVFAQQAKDAFVIGGVVPLSGAYALLGTSMQKAVDLAVEQRGTALSKPLRVLWEDSETKPQTSVQKANKLLAGGVSMLFGDGASGQTMAIMPVADQRKVPLLVTTSAADAITGASRNRYTFRTASQSFVETRIAAEYVKKAGLKSVYVVAVDQPVGRDTWTTMKTVLAPMGVTVAGEDFAAIGSQDYSVIIDKVAKSGAQGLFIVTGSFDCRERGPSSETSTPRLLAINSMALPVPAAHFVFIRKSTSPPCSSTLMALQSCPPPSMTVLTLGASQWAPRPWQEISLMLLWAKGTRLRP